MDPTVRVVIFQRWRALVKRNPSKYRMVRLNSDYGTFGLEKCIDNEWILISRIPRWDKYDGLDDFVEEVVNEKSDLN